MSNCSQTIPFSELLKFAQITAMHKSTTKNVIPFAYCFDNCHVSFSHSMLMEMGLLVNYHGMNIYIRCVWFHPALSTISIDWQFGWAMSQMQTYVSDTFCICGLLFLKLKTCSTRFDVVTRCDGTGYTLDDSPKQKYFSQSKPSRNQCVCIHSTNIYHLFILLEIVCSHKANQQRERKKNMVRSQWEIIMRMHMKPQSSILSSVTCKFCTLNKIKPNKWKRAPKQ